MINLFYIIHDFSGAQTYANELLYYLSIQQGIKAHVVYLDNQVYNEYRVVQEKDILNIYIPKVRRKAGTLQKYSARCIDLMAPLLKSKKNIIFHLNYSIQVKFGLEARKRFNARLVYTLHYLPDYFSLFANKDINPEELNITDDILDREMVLESNHIICVTKFAKHMLVQHYSTPKEKVSVIYNGCSQVNYNGGKASKSKEELKLKLGYSTTNQIILFVGRLEFGKGVEKLINAFNRISKENPDLKLVLVGKGDFNPFMELCRQNFGRIAFTGKLPNEMVKQLYGIADIGVIPSEFEQCSYVALEMMQHGLPIIATEAPGLKELFRHKHGAILIPLQKRKDGLLGFEVNENALYLSLKELTRNKILQRKLSNNSKQKWEQNFTVKHMGQATLQVYKQLFTPLNKSTEANTKIHQCTGRLKQ